MSYTDIICVLMFADSDAHELAQEWLDAIPAESHFSFCSLLRAA